MSLFDAVLARTAGTAEVVEPVRPVWFEPTELAAADDDEVVEELDAASSEPGPVVIEVAAPPAEVPGVPPAPTLVPADPDRPASPSMAPPAAPVPSPMVEPIPSPPGSVDPAASPPAAAPTPVVGPSASIAPEPRTPPVPSRPPADPPVPGWPVAAAAPDRALVMPAPPDPVASRSVEITIGRIEVVTPRPESAAVPSRPAPEPTPRVALADYLDAGGRVARTRGDRTGGRR